MINRLIRLLTSSYQTPMNLQVYLYSRKTSIWGPQSNSRKPPSTVRIDGERWWEHVPLNPKPPCQDRAGQVLLVFCFKLGLMVKGPEGPNAYQSYTSAKKLIALNPELMRLRLPRFAARESIASRRVFAGIDERALPSLKK